MAYDVKDFILKKKLGRCIMMGHSMYVLTIETAGYINLERDTVC